ncbi:MAG: penicillin-binding protein 2, partial [Myxococcales bacterium]|nr:penicillin-binding protein 2 [Myxococcales bacterium]
MSPQRWMRVRIAFLGALLFVGAGLVVRRGYELQIERGAVLAEMGEEQYLKNVRLAPKRGTIYDREGAELAVSVDVDSVYANPRQLRKLGKDPHRVAAQLASILPIDSGRIAARLSKDRLFVWIERQVTPQQAAAVKALGIEGIGLRREAKRFYPNRHLAAHILGFANVDGNGIEGLELSYDAALRGTTSAVPAIKDNRGSIVFSSQLLDDRASIGDSVTLSIDKTIQHIAERELELGVRTFEAAAGSVVVTDPQTGEVLAIANYPTFNPNEPSKYPASHHRDRSVTDRYEPGSTVKPFTVAGALATGAVRANQRFDCENGAMEVAEYTIHDTHRWEELSTGQILAQSSNIGSAKIGFAMGRRGLFRGLRKFGFGTKTGIALPGETGGILRHYKKWYDMDAATIAFGQGMSVNTMQLAMAMGAIANGGMLMKPLLVKRVTNPSGELVQEFAPTAVRRAVPKWTARVVSDMLTAVTEPDGTGAEAAMDGYLVAGKTGTAQKADYVAGGYAEGKWISSFVGFAPADRPRIVIAVTIDEPLIAHYGGTVAGPVFRRIGEAALQHLGVPARGGGTALVRPPKEVDRTKDPAAAGDGHTSENLRVAAAEGLDDQPTIVKTSTLLRERDGLLSVPDLRGVTARKAMVLATKSGLSARIEG